MAIRTRKAGPFMVLVSGMDADLVPASAWKAALNEFGENLQAIISNTFAAQRTAAGALRANDPAYTAAKVRQGYDPRRGHRTNTLQSLLRPGAARLFVVIGPDRHGNGRIIMQEGRLHGIVPYAEYYEEKKVRGAGILEVATTWLKAASAPLLVLDAQARITARQGLAGRAAFIRPALGLTNRLASSLGRQARAIASVSPKARALLRRLGG